MSLQTNEKKMYIMYKHLTLLKSELSLLSYKMFQPVRKILIWHTDYLILE